MNKPPKPCRICRRAVKRRGLCGECYKAYERRRGTPAQRGYNAQHDKFRAAVLARDPLCVLCGGVSTVADHYPQTLRQLVAKGLNPYDPQCGRGLCEICHNRATAQASYS